MLVKTTADVITGGNVSVAGFLGYDVLEKA